MSARVGSIGDNSIGGWHSYRSSKTALNQLNKCMSIEFARKKQNVACILLHPGTVDTDLSKPFQKVVPAPAWGPQLIFFVTSHESPQMLFTFSRMKYTSSIILCLSCRCEQLTSTISVSKRHRASDLWVQTHLVNLVCLWRADVHIWTWPKALHFVHFAASLGLLAECEAGEAFQQGAGHQAAAGHHFKCHHGRQRPLHCLGWRDHTLVIRRLSAMRAFYILLLKTLDRPSFHEPI